jgi:Carboxypeptidase regulatory-like domain/TonB dependent receptor/TonB-dependent Receptor Plug Domain
MHCSSLLAWRGATFLLLLCVLSAPAQSPTATLRGEARDQSGAAVPDVNIILVHQATRLERSAITGATGDFILTLLPPGNYTLKAERRGFAPLEMRDLNLNVGDERSLRLHLQVGDVSATVNIEGAAQMLNESPAVGTVINRRFIENLPLNGRSLQSLINLTPGVVPTISTGGRQGQFSVNGQRESANYFTVDGVSANLAMSLNANPFGGSGQYGGFNALGATNSLVSVDALEEFRIQTSSFAPEFGRTPGAQVQLVTRAGATDLHGSLFEYFRNEKLDANDWFANRGVIARQPLRQNFFGGTFSGPLWLPKRFFGPLGSERQGATFFFFSYEGLKLRLPQAGVREVPSVESRNAATAVSKAILQAFPLPNGRETANGLAEFVGGWSDPSSSHAASLRLDHNFSSRLTVFGRYNYAPSERLARSTSLGHLVETRYKVQTLTAGATWIISPRITNDLRFNYSRNEGDYVFTPDGFAGGVPLPASAVFPSFTSAAESQITIFLTSANSPSINIGSRSGNGQTQYNLVNNTSVTSGAHQMKFGADWRRLLPNLTFARHNHSVFFNNIDQVLTNRPARVSVGVFNGPIYPRFTNLSFFGQDIWKISSRLTLTYGLRYEINPPPSERDGRNPPIVSGLSDPATAMLAPRGTQAYETIWNNIAPRLGVAYQLVNVPRYSAVLRGGFGLFHDISTGQFSAVYDPFRYPYTASASLTNPNYPLTDAEAASPVFSDLPPYRSVVAFDPKLKLPYTLQWNVTLEQSLGAANTVSASYVAAAGRRLYYTESYVRPSAVIEDLDVVSNAATSDYHALQLQFQRRLTKGLQALASYTWSHSLDTASTEVQTGNLPLAVNPAAQNRASSDFDRRHSFNLAATYNLPRPKWGRFGTAIFNGWSVDGIYRALSAAPVNVFSRVTGRPGSINAIFLRPDLVAGQPLYVSDPTEPGGRRINRAAFTTITAADNRQGNFGRNVLRGFDLSQLDFTLRRQFDFTERFNAQFRVELFNALNQPGFGDPTTNLTSTLFGRSTQMLGRSLGGLNALYQIGGPRSIQLALKLQF